MKKPFLCLIGIHKTRFVTDADAIDRAREYFNDKDIEEGDFIIYRVFEQCARCQRYGKPILIQKVPKKKK